MLGTRPAVWKAETLDSADRIKKNFIVSSSLAGKKSQASDRKLDVLEKVILPPLLDCCSRLGARGLELKRPISISLQLDDVDGMYASTYKHRRVVKNKY